MHSPLGNRTQPSRNVTEPAKIRMDADLMQISYEKSDQNLLVVPAITATAIQLNSVCVFNNRKVAHNTFCVHFN